MYELRKIGHDIPLWGGEGGICMVLEEQPVLLMVAAQHLP